MKNEFEEHKYFMYISGLNPISDIEKEQFITHLNHMSDSLLFKLLTDKESEKGIL